LICDAAELSLSVEASWDQQDLANCLAVLERGLRFGRLRQRILAEDVDF
jgi:hypothetical protein